MVNCDHLFLILDFYVVHFVVFESKKLFVLIKVCIIFSIYEVLIM